GAVAVAAFLVGDSGAPYRWEGALLHNGARIGAVSVPTMRDSESASTVTVRNTGREIASTCQVRVADYRARDGYLTGHSAFFDLAIAETRVVPLPLETARSVPGEHRFRISLECQHRLKDRTTTTIRIER